MFWEFEKFWEKKFFRRLKENEEIPSHHSKKSVQVTLRAIKEIQEIILAGEDLIIELLSEGINLRELYTLYSNYEKSEIDLEIKGIIENIKKLFQVYNDFSKSEKIYRQNLNDQQSLFHYFSKFFLIFQFYLDEYNVF